MRYSSIVFLFLVFCMFSCVRVQTEGSFLKMEEMPVVFSVISPDIPVKVSLSKTLIESSLPDKLLYPDARVYLSADGTNWTELQRTEDESSPESEAIYRDKNNDFLIEKGGTYFLKVELEDLTLRAKTSVPTQKAEIVTAEIELFKEETYTRALLKTKLDLSPKEKEHACLLSVFSKVHAADEVFVETENYSIDLYGVPEDAVSADVCLLTLNTNLKNFWKAASLSEFENYYDDAILIDIILGFNGTKPLYSNIENGVGLFASYLVDKKMWK